MSISIHEVEAAARPKIDECATGFESTAVPSSGQTRHSIKYVVALAVGLILFELGLVLLGLFSAAGATTQQKSVSNVAAVTDSNRGGNATFNRNGAAVLTSQLPWRAPVGHRRPGRADVPQEESVRAGKHVQHNPAEIPDSKLIICRCFGS